LVHGADAQRALVALDWAVDAGGAGGGRPEGRACEQGGLPGGVGRLPRGCTVEARPDHDEPRRRRRGWTRWLESGALSAILPEVEAMVGFGMGSGAQGRLEAHEQWCVRRVPRLECGGPALFTTSGR